MDSLIKQIRVRFSGAGVNRQEQRSSVDRRLAPQKSEKKTGQKWLRRQFSGQMSGEWEYEFDNEIEQVTAIAAAVFAVRSIEQLEIVQKNNKNEHTFVAAPNPPPMPLPRPPKLSRPLSDEDFLKDSSDGKMAQENERSEKPIPPSSSLSKTPTFSDKKSDRSGRKKPETISVPSSPPPPPIMNKPKPPPPTTPPVLKSSPPRPPSPVINKPKPPPPPQPPSRRPPSPPIVKKPSAAPTETVKPSPTRSFDPRDKRADSWEKAEIAKINEKYEKVNDTISYWEIKKRDKAKGKLELAQGVGVDKRKNEKALRKFEEDIDFINQIAGEARAKAGEKRRNDIMKVRQKADIIRKTGELPVTCFCC